MTDKEQAAKEPHSLLKDIGKVFAVALMFVLIAMFFQRYKDTCLDIGRFRSLIRQNYILGTVAFILVGSIMAGFGLPRLVISTIAGMLFGACAGFLWGILTSLFGATINFLWARFFMRGPILRHMPKKMIPWYNRFNQKGFKYMLFIRLFPLSNSTATNILGGVSRIPYISFISATIIGWIPLAIVFSLFGSSASKRDFKQLLLGVIIFILVFITERAISKWSKKHNLDKE